MIIRHFNTQTKQYETSSIRVRTTEKFRKLQRSRMPKNYLNRTPPLIYITEFLKGDGTVSIIRRGNSWLGNLIFSTIDDKYKQELKRILLGQFPEIKIFDRKDGLGISSFVLSVLLSKNFGIPVGKKQEMKVTEPKNLEEAKMVLRAIIDTEGNIDDYEGRIVIGNQSINFLDSYTKVLNKWFDIKISKLSPTKGWGEETLRIGITRDEDVIKIYKIGLLNPTKQDQLKQIYLSFEKYRNKKEEFRKNIILILKEKPKTIRELSDEISLSPFLIRRLLKLKIFGKIGKVQRGKRFAFLWVVK